MIRYLCNVSVNDDHQSIADRIVKDYYPDCEHGGVGLFVLEPGQMHPAHVDIQPPEWVTRIHVPLETNFHCTATTARGYHLMDVGMAYEFDTTVEHAVSNAGKTPRIHLVFDIKRK
jgi:hypothetical protein